MKIFSFFLLCILLNRLPQTKGCESHTIIVGGGIAGLGAAQELIEGQCNVTILEANSQLGGRIKSVEIGNYTTDIGAFFIQGMGPGAGNISLVQRIFNPIFSLAYNNSLEIFEGEFSIKDGTNQTYHWSNGTIQNYTIFEQNKEELLDYISTQYEEEINVNSSFSDLISNF